jgi:hypothetical protein
MVDIDEGKEIVEAVARSKGVFSEAFIARDQASGDKEKLDLIKANKELREDVARSLEK